ncbi:MAG TPA: glycosyltransferase family 2 protein [Candidatus Nanopelagicaceae bacterium]
MAESAKDRDGHRVTAILVVHDGATWLPEVVAALVSQTRAIDYTLAVDTDSNDASVKLLKNARVPFISLPRETGFGAAIAAAVERIPPSAEEDEWLWFIHDDCAPAPESLQALLDAIEDRPQVAIAGPKLRGWYDRTHLLEAGVTIAGNGARWTGLEPHEYDQGQLDGIRDVLAVSTAGMLVRRSVYDELGGFDPNILLFRDDIDLGWRARVAGYSVIAVTDAIALHAEASASERRNVDVKSAFHNRPLLLDRRNAAYVLLANSSLWLLPWLSLQLFASALVRASGFFLAKLPGYASDEILAVTSLVFRPGLVLNARRLRRSGRLLSPRVVAAYIPPRWSQIRLEAARVGEAIRQKILPTTQLGSSALEAPTEDDDLLTSVPLIRWRSAFRRPEISVFLILIIISSIWSRHRFGALAGGALPASPSGAIDLWRRYGDSWHAIGMGSSTATPTWIAVMALASTVMFGKTVLFMATLFWATPLLLFWSMYLLLRKLTTNSWLAVGASLAYALSPVAISTVNSGRLGTMAVLIIAPQIARYLPRLTKIEDEEWQFLFAFSILMGILTSFSLPAFLGIVAIYLFGIGHDFRSFLASRDRRKFTNRLLRRLTMIATPFLLCLPWSLEALTHPSRFLLEPGLSMAGGSSNLALLGNPGGVGSIPWWFISPVTLILLVAVFSSTHARKYAETGLAFLVIASLATAISFPSHGNALGFRLWVGPWLTYATVAAVAAGVIILDGLREKLITAHVHRRHFYAGLGVASTLIYCLAATSWVLSVGADSPVHANQAVVLPAFLTVTPGVKTLVLQSAHAGDKANITYFVARESDVLLGDPDVVPRPSPILEGAVAELIDGSGLMSSKVFGAHGIKYLFMKNPVDNQIVRTIDGIGGFVRVASTQSGIVWQVAGVSDRLVFTDTAGNARGLLEGDIKARTSTSGPGVISLAENYDSSWQIIQNGEKLIRSRNQYGLPQFTSTVAGPFSLIHDGTTRRAWLALEMIFLLITLIMALPAGRRKREISVEELT